MNQSDLMKLDITVRRWSFLIGFIRQASHPASSIISLSSSKIKAVCAIIGSSLRIFLISFVASIPFISGICMSRSTTSISGVDFIISIASNPDLAVNYGNSGIDQYSVQVDKDVLIIIDKKAFSGTPVFTCDYSDR